jgi:hypothetical protein
MRGLTILLLLVVLAAGCKKDNIDPNDTNNPNDTRALIQAIPRLKAIGIGLGKILFIFRATLAGCIKPGRSMVVYTAIGGRI